jgi:hypothetical protein
MLREIIMTAVLAFIIIIIIIIVVVVVVVVVVRGKICYDNFHTLEPGRIL